MANINGQRTLANVATFAVCQTPLTFAKWEKPPERTCTETRKVLETWIAAALTGRRPGREDALRG